MISTGMLPENTDKIRRLDLASDLDQVADLIEKIPHALSRVLNEHNMGL